MTTGNKLRLQKVAVSVIRIRTQKDPQMAAMHLLEVQSQINTILLDLTLRPEVNTDE